MTIQCRMKTSIHGTVDTADSTGIGMYAVLRNCKKTSRKVTLWNSLRSQELLLLLQKFGSEVWIDSGAASIIVVYTALPYWGWNKKGSFDRRGIVRRMLRNNI
ncbi:hypothetical protein HHX47_DHR10000428, partial [Lentinula edodes]